MTMEAEGSAEAGHAARGAADTVEAAYTVGRCAVGARVMAIKSATLSPAKQGQRQTASLLPNQQRLL